MKLNRLAISFLLLILFATNLAAQAGIYRWVDENGVVHFSDAPPDDESGIQAEIIDVQDVQTSFRTVPTVPGPASATESARDSAQAATEATSNYLVLHPSSDCRAPSPTVRNGGDLYAIDAEPVVLDRSDIALVNSMMRKLRGRWRGLDTGFVCEDSAGAEIKTPRIREIVAEGDFNPPESFVLDSTIASQGSNHRETLRIDTRQGFFRVNSSIASLFSVTESDIAFGYRLRVGGLVTEFYWHVELVDTRIMTLRQWIYTQGNLNSVSTWELTKPQ